MNVLSLFDGIAAGRLALNKAGIKIDNYISSEIKQEVIDVVHHHFPDTIEAGNVIDLTYKKGRLISGTTVIFEGKIDLLIGGSPCKGFSYAGKQLNFEDPMSKLFFEFVRIKNEIQAENPNLIFLLENVKMKMEFEKVITDYLGVEPTKINSSLLSAQNRERLYWTNIQGITQPSDKKISINDVLEDNVDVYHYDKTFDNKQERIKGWLFNNDIEISKEDYKEYNPKINVIGNFSGYQNDRLILTNGKSATLTAGGGNNGGIGGGLYSTDGNIWRKLTPLECERLQTIPDNYTNMPWFTLAKRYESIGRSWTVDVVAHIFSFMKNV